MTSEKRAQKLHIDETSLLRCWAVLLTVWKFASTNQQDYPDVDGDENKDPSPVGAEVPLTTGVCTLMESNTLYKTGVCAKH